MLVAGPRVQNVLVISLGLQDPWKGLPLICTAISLEPLRASNCSTNDQGVVFDRHHLHVVDGNTTRVRVRIFASIDMPQKI